MVHWQSKKPNLEVKPLLNKLVDLPLMTSPELKAEIDITINTRIKNGRMVGYSFNSDKIWPHVFGDNYGCGVNVYSTFQKFNHLDVEKIVELYKNNKPKTVLNKKCEALNIDKLPLGKLPQNEESFVSVMFDEQERIYVAVHGGSGDVGKAIKEKYGQEEKSYTNAELIEALQYATGYAARNRNAIALRLEAAGIEINNRFVQQHNFVTSRDVSGNRLCFHYVECSPFKQNTALFLEGGGDNGIWCLNLFQKKFSEFQTFDGLVVPFDDGEGKFTSQKVITECWGAINPRTLFEIVTITSEE